MAKVLADVPVIRVADLARGYQREELDCCFFESLRRHERLR
jgi:hypothetical protein